MWESLVLLLDTSDPPDFRGRVMLAYTLVFAVIVTYLVFSHRKQSKARKTIEFLEGRVESLEKRERSEREAETVGEA